MTKVVLALDNGCGYDDYRDLCYIQINSEDVEKVKELANEQVDKHRKLEKKYFIYGIVNEELKRYRNDPISTFAARLSHAGIYAEFFIPSEWVSIQTY